MVPAVLRLHFPEGSLPTQGHRCPICAAEMVLPEEARRTRAEAERLGLFGLAKLGKRKVTTNGTSPSVNLGEYLAEIGAHTGDTLDVGVRGDTIVLRKGTAKASSRKPSRARRR